MSEREKRTIKVFIASPNDLAEERRKFRDAITVLNIGFGDGANVEFIPLGWEDTLASTGRRSQGVINQDIDTCDVFILTMHRRWGQDAPDAAPYSSYTEEEFHRALERWKKSGSPEIFVFFKRVDAASEADAGPQLKKVIEFRKQLEESRKILYHYFDSHQSFLEKVDRHLRAFAKDELPKADEQREIIVLPIAALQEVEKAKQIALQKTEEARQANEVAEAARLQLEIMQLQMAEDAAQLAMEGKVEFAREKFTKLISKTKNLQILFLGFEFFYRTGDLASTRKVLEKWLSLSGDDNISEETAAAFGNLGLLYQILGDLHQAEEMCQKSLSIYEILGHQEGIANQYTKLGLLYGILGDLDRSEEMYRKSLAINEALGQKEGLAINYNNLAILYQNRGEVDLAEEMFRKSLAINEILCSKEGIAASYGNLGILYEIRGYFDQAEVMHKKSLIINEELGRKEGIAASYLNLGNVYLKRSLLERAEEMFLKSLVIEEVIGHKKVIAMIYENLGNLYRTRGALDQAEEMSTRSLTINEALGCKEGVASAYGNLGNVFLKRNQLERAEMMYKKILVIQESLGNKEVIAKTYANLGNLYKIRGEIDKSEEMYEKSFLLFQKIQSPDHMKVYGLLQDLKDGDFR